MQKWICNVRNRENALTYEEDAKKCLTAGMMHIWRNRSRWRKQSQPLRNIVRNNNFGQIFQRIGI